MKLLSRSIILLSLFTFLSSCTDDDKSNGSYDCTFKQVNQDMDGVVDDTELAIMNECNESAFTSISEIEKNLIGEWELIGFGAGWFAATSQPCIYLTFTKDELVFDISDGSRDTIVTYGWEVEKRESGDYTFFIISLAPEYEHPLAITTFSLKYMFGDARAGDGNMYLYEKVK